MGSGPAAYTTVGATYQPPQSACVNQNNRWFKFTATDTYIKATVYGGTISFIQYNLFSADYTSVGCGTGTAGLSDYTFERTDLVIGQVYYLSIASDNNGRGSFGIRISTVKDYNYIEGAITIQHRNGWNSGPEAYTTVGATYQPPQSGCSNLNNRWFKFTATDPYLKMTVYGGSITYIQYNLFSGNNYTPLACGQATFGLSSYTFENTNLIIGTTYYLSIASGNTGRGSFGISMQSGAIPDYWTLTESVLHPTETTNSLAVGTSTVPEGFRVAIQGKVLAEGVKVQLKNKWPDYVFEEDYLLLPLSELKKFIEENKHLPGIPPASEMEKEGIDVEQVNIQLLKKIEELTLHIIEQNARIESLERKMAENESGQH